MDETKRKRHREYMRKWRDENLARAKEIQRNAYWKNRDKRKANMVAARAADPEHYRKEAMRRHHARMENDPAYATRHRQDTRYHHVLYQHPHFRAGISKHYAEEVRMLYDACPPGLEVDHIHPLRGHNSCGLHVPWNLQYLSGRENKIKGKKIDIA